MNRKLRSIQTSPLLWGGLATLAFYGVLEGLTRALEGTSLMAYTSRYLEFAERYFTKHPVEYAIVALFFVGLAALAIKSRKLLAERTNLNAISLDAPPVGGQSITTAASMLSHLQTLPRHLRESCLGSRLQRALAFISKKQSVEELDQQLWHLNDEDSDRMHSSYSLIRIVVWAVPILGFLGTVIGLTGAISKLNVTALENPDQVLRELGVAFDTTALALAFSLVLMFAKHYVEGSESKLLSLVDQRTDEMLMGRFQESVQSKDPNVATIQRMANAVVESTHQLVQQQAGLWRESIDSANERWSQLADSAGAQLDSSLRDALETTLSRHAETIIQIEQTVATENRRHWLDVQTALTHSAEVVVEQQSELVRQGDILRQVVDATGQVKRLEMALNENLETLAQASHFEETATSLAAAVQLLSVRMKPQAGDTPRVEIQHEDSVGDAA